MFNEHIIFLDLETTGGSASVDRIIEIGLVEVERGRLVGEWSTLVNPGRPIPHGIQVLTGITDEMVAAAPKFEEISEALAKRLDGKVFAAHNAPFDYGFIRNELRRAGLSYRAPVLCTVKLSRRLFPQYPRHNLDALIVRHAIFCLDRHRALGDAQVLWALAQIWKRELSAQIVNDTCQDLLRPPSVPAGLAEDVFDALPEAPGVYLFYGDADAALYVGRSANIRSRVMAHFSGDRRVARDLRIAEQIRRVDWIETAGELGAYIEESRLVRKLTPAYNRGVKHPGEACGWLWRPEAPQSPPALVGTGELEADAFANLYGLFRSRPSAVKALRELSAAHNLCCVMMGLERPQDGGCAAYRSARCRGACVGVEPPIGHAVRALQALSRLRMKPWPYPGRIALRERNPEGDRTELHVVEQWRHLGSAASEADLHELTETSCAAPFNLDTYKMLARLISSPPRGCSIIPLHRNAEEYHHVR